MNNLLVRHSSDFGFYEEDRPQKLGGSTLRDENLDQLRAKIRLRYGRWSNADLDHEVRRLRNRSPTSRKTRASSRTLAFAIQKCGYLNAKLQALRPTFQAAAPGPRRVDVDVEPVTADELAGALAVLSRERPRLLAS